MIKKIKDMLRKSQGISKSSQNIYKSRMKISSMQKMRRITMKEVKPRKTKSSKGGNNQKKPKTVFEIKKMKKVLRKSHEINDYMLKVEGLCTFSNVQ
jgi:hypothetical protein